MRTRSEWVQCVCACVHVCVCACAASCQSASLQGMVFWLNVQFALYIRSVLSHPWPVSQLRHWLNRRAGCAEGTWEVKVGWTASLCWDEGCYAHQQACVRRDKHIKYTLSVVQRGAVFPQASKNWKWHQYMMSFKCIYLYVCCWCFHTVKRKDTFRLYLLFPYFSIINIFSSCSFSRCVSTSTCLETASAPSACSE